MHLPPPKKNFHVFTLFWSEYTHIILHLQFYILCYTFTWSVNKLHYTIYTYMKCKS